MIELLETGSWPALCTGRRDWSKGRVMLEIPLPNSSGLRRTGKRWVKIKRGLPGRPSQLYTRGWMSQMDDFQLPVLAAWWMASFLALPGSGNRPEPKNSVDKALGQLWASNHRALKHVACTGAQLEPELSTSLQASCHTGPIRRHTPATGLGCGNSPPSTLEDTASCTIREAVLDRPSLQPNDAWNVKC